MTYVLVAGEIDLSVGSAYGLLTVIMGLLVVPAGLSPWLALPMVIVVGVAHGHAHRPDRRPVRHPLLHRHAGHARRLPQPWR